MKAEQKCWRYHPEEGAKIFARGEVIPDGWFDTPAKFPESIENMSEEERAYYFGVWGWESSKPDFTLEELNKVELEEYARTMGVELDRRKSKTNMIKDFYEAIR